MISDSLTVEAPAKINLGLWVTGKRGDGYHDLLTVFQAVDLKDTLELRPAPEGDLSLTVAGLPAPEGEDNLVLRAARSLWDRAGGERPGAALKLTKRIPLGAGLGGGSSDAAAALVGLNRLWGLNLEPEALAAQALELGSDVPFFLVGGTALGRSRGERLTPLRPPCREWGWVLALAGVSVSTTEVFQKLPSPLPVSNMTARRLRELVEQGDLASLGQELVNQLEPVACALHPTLRRIRDRLEGEAPPGSVISMSGSGSAFFILTPREASARAWVEEVRSGGGPADTPHEGVELVVCPPLHSRL